MRRCLDCRVLCSASRCLGCTAARKSIRNADRPIARAVVAASPVCAECGATTDLTAEHVQPLKHGGSNEGRRRVLCRPCNSSRRDRGGHI